MCRIIMLFILCQISFQLSAQHESRIDSKITSVTVFLNRAQVTRVAETKIRSGKTNIIIQGLTSMLDQQSIQVSGKGRFTILGINHQQNFAREIQSVKLKVLKDSIELLQRQLTLEQSQKEILNKEEQMLMSNQKIGGTDQNLTVAELKAMVDFYRTRLTNIVSERMSSDMKIKSLSESLQKLQNQVREYGETVRKNSSDIVVTVSAESETSGKLEVNYVVANAGWLPVYDLRAVNTKTPIQLMYKANVFQNTGEEWDNVKLNLSTANPNLGGVKPELSTWYIDILRPVVRTARLRYSEKSKAEAAAPQYEMHQEENADLDTIDANSIAQYTETIQTTLNTEFNIAVPYTVRSSSKPTLVDVASHSLDADYLYAVAPKLDRDAFLMARITGWEELSLLPGEANIFFEGTFVAKSFIDPSSIKDTLSISLGRDKRIVVQREKVKDLSSRKTIGSNQREEHAFVITVRNTKAEAINIIVEDHIPVSKSSELEVTLVEGKDANYQKDFGKLKWELTLDPQESKNVAYKFEIKYPKDKMTAEIY